MKTLFTVLILCACSFGQLIPLTRASTNAGQRRFKASEISVPVRGTEDQTVVVEWLDLLVSGMAEASLELAMRVEGRHSLYVMVTFFDADTNAVFGQTFCSNEGPTLAGVRWDLQAAPLFSKLIGQDHYVLRGWRTVFLHQSLIAEQEAAGISPVTYFTIQVFHLMAG